MEGRDFRSIGRSAQEELRRRALVLIEQQGLSQAQAAEVVGVQRQTVNIKTWVSNHAHEIELFYLPAYAPDHNPDEYLNNDLKQQLRQRPQLLRQTGLLK
jgi:transposase